MTIPTDDVPAWATDAVYSTPAAPWDGAANKLAPAPEKISSGFQPNERPAAEHLNYVLSGCSSWIEWLAQHTRSMLAGNWQRATPSTLGTPKTTIALSTRPFTRGERWCGLAIMLDASDYPKAQRASADCSEWSDASAGIVAAAHSIRDVVWHPNANLWIAVGDDQVHTLSAGMTATWTSAGNSPNDLLAICSGPLRAAAVGVSGLVQTTNDGVSWVTRSTGGGTLTAVAYGGGRYVAIGDGYLKTSSDAGVTWSSVTDVALAGAQSIVYDEGFAHFVVFTYDGSATGVRVSAATGNITATWALASLSITRAVYSPAIGIVVSAEDLAGGAGVRFGAFMSRDGGVTFDHAGQFFAGFDGEHTIDALHVSAPLGRMLVGGSEQVSGIPASKTPVIAQSPRSM